MLPISLTTARVAVPMSRYTAAMQTQMPPRAADTSLADYNRTVSTGKSPAECDGLPIEREHS
jgi:hypothetical protein